MIDDKEREPGRFERREGDSRPAGPIATVVRERPPGDEPATEALEPGETGRSNTEQSDTGTEPPAADTGTEPPAEVMANLPRRRPHRRTARRAPQRPRTATVPRRPRAAKPPARPRLVHARRRAAAAEPPRNDLGLAGQVVAQTLRIGLDASTIGFRLAGTVLRRVAGRGSG